MSKSLILNLLHSIVQPSVHLDCMFSVVFLRLAFEVEPTGTVHVSAIYKISCVLPFFFLGSHGTVHEPLNLAKHRFLGKFGFYSTFHIFKNYFTTMFSAINF